MMKKRIISAAIALIVSLPFIYIGGIPFYLYAMILGILGFREILNLVTDNVEVKVINYINFITIIGSSFLKNSFDNIIDYKIIGVILLLNSLVMLYNHKNKKLNIEKNFCLIGITLFLGIAFSTLIITRNISIYYFIFIFLVAFANDTFAHSIGTLFGKHKINEISPNKTWEGCIGGLVLGTLISTLFYLVFINTSINIFKIIFVTMFLSIIGQLGDLFFSQIKRNYKIKDFSNIMPGHGGILDRLDSVIFIALAFTYFINYL